jgi:DNA repair exonuclease SbcCD ATPase subunit
LKIEFLQEKNHQLERRLEELLQTKREVINEKFKNEDLVRDIKEINRLAKKAELEKQMVVSAADRELDQVKMEMKRSREELSNMDSVVHQLEVEKLGLANELDRFKSELDARLNEINNLRNLVDKIQDDKTKLTKKISKLLDNERELVQELDSFKSGRRSNSSTLTRTNSTKSLTAKLDSHIKNIENERDYFRQEVDTLQKLLKSAHNDHLARSMSATRLKDTTNSQLSYNQRSVSPSRRPLSASHRSRRENDDAISPGRFNGASSQTRCSVCAIKLSGKSSGAASPSGRAASSSGTSRASLEEISKLKRERDELQKLLDKFEHHMVEVRPHNIFPIL